MDENSNLLNLPIIYENNLQMENFTRLFNNNSQGYKFYWFEALLNLTQLSNKDWTFDEIFDEMICNAWHTVTLYHLRLGPVVNGKAVNCLERLVHLLNDVCKNEISQNPSKKELKYAIQNHPAELKKDKKKLEQYVPYKFLTPFFEKDELAEGLQYIRNDQHKRLIAYLPKISNRENLLYTIVDGIGMKKKVKMNVHWRKFLLNNFVIIQSWIQYNKVQFLQDRNPGVPGIVYKINAEDSSQRKLDQVRELWKSVATVTGKPLKEIYTGKDIQIQNLSIDHFVPRSYISNDELWNLIPMTKELNSTKNNKLPKWNLFFQEFAHYQYYLYHLVFPKQYDIVSQTLFGKFEKCKKNNLNAIWATENLYVPGNSEEQFINILSKNLHPIYDAAKVQGYDVWNLTN